MWATPGSALELGRAQLGIAWHVTWYPPRSLKTLAARDWFVTLMTDRCCIWKDQSVKLPGKHAGSSSYLIGTGLEALARTRPDDLCSPALLPDRTHLAKTWHSQPEPNQIWAGFVQHDPHHLCKNAKESESGKLVGGWWQSARTGPGDSCTLAGFQTQSIWPKLNQAIQTGYGLVLPGLIWAFLGNR